MVTIYDIAKETNLSPSTVSKVLNGYKGVSENAKTLVTQAVKVMGYTPNTSARTLITKKSWLIGVLYSDNIESGIAHPHFNEILDGVNKAAEKNGYDIVLINRQVGDKLVSYYEHCRYRGVDGVLIAADITADESVECVVNSPLQSVSVERIYTNVPTVISDNYMGTMQALEYLYFLGHRKIAILECPLNSLAGVERRKAYVEFMQMKNLPLNANYMVESAGFTGIAGADATRRLLMNTWSDLPTAIFASYDEIACACQAIFQAQGFRIPDDISIIGFDDLNITDYMHPKITTVRQERALIGQKAIELLVENISHPENKFTGEMRIPTKLIVRDSCRRLAT